MAIDTVTLAVSRKYTDQTVIGLGGLKGAPAIIKDIVHQDGINVVTFEWTGTDGSKQTRDMIVYDGTPIYVWESGNTYNYGDLVIYSSTLYRCLVKNNDIVFHRTKYEEIGASDGNYDIVEDSSLLPVNFTSADRKMYYSIADEYFWLWNGQGWQAQRNLKLAEFAPNAATAKDNAIVLYIGDNTNGFIKGRLYQYKISNNSWNDVTNIDYSNVTNKPQINGNTLEGNKTSAELGIRVMGTYEEENLYLHC